MTKSKAISKNIERKLVSATLEMKQLKTIHQQDPENGISNVFKEFKIAQRSNIINKVNENISSILWFIQI